MAQKTQEADLIIANAKKEGREIVKDQKQKANNIIEKAEKKSADIIEQAEKKATETERIRTESVSQVRFLNQNANDLRADIHNLKSQLKNLQEEVLIGCTIISVDETITSEEYKSKYNLLVLEEKELIKNDRSIIQRSYENKKMIDSDGVQ